MNRKCTNCNLPNFMNAENCARCGDPLSEIASEVSDETRAATTAPKHRIGYVIIRRAVICILTILFIVIGFYASLVLSSSPLNSEERATVGRAIELLAEKGFYDEVFYLRRVTVFRSSDNWLNSLVPKENAYAATNYPFGIVTVYPDFFAYTKDDVERAAILLHEAKHLQGEDEKVAYEYVWANRQRLGWVRKYYARSVLWKNVRKQTKEYAPSLFICEFNDFGDCTQSVPELSRPDLF